MKKLLFDRARDIQDGILESRMVARMETEHRPLTDKETISECEYILDIIDYAGYDRKYTADIKRACKYILKAGKEQEREKSMTNKEGV